MSNSLSVTISNPIPSSGRPITDKIIEIATKLAAGTPATPIEVNKAVITIINCCTKLNQGHKFL